VPFDPVNVITGEVAFRQTDVEPLTVADGKGLTVTAASPDCACEHPVLLASRTLTSL
jgi:hypothetical protein